MSKLHHTQIKQAAKLGYTLAASDNTPGLIIATKGSETIQAMSFKDVMQHINLAASEGLPKSVTAGLKSEDAITKHAEEHRAKEVEASKAAIKAAKPKKAKKKAAKKRKDADEDEEGEGDEEGSGKGSVVKAAYKRKYRPTKDTCGDRFVEAFRAATLEDPDDDKSSIDLTKLAKVAKENGLTIAPWQHLRNKDGGVNVGMIRMNLGNVLRGMVRNGKEIKFGGVVFEGDKVEEKPKKKAASKKKEA